VDRSTTRSSTKGATQDEETSLVSDWALVEWDEELPEVVFEALGIVTGEKRGRGLDLYRNRRGKKKRIR